MRKFVFSMIGVVLAATFQLNSPAVAAEREAMPLPDSARPPL